MELEKFLTDITALPGTPGYEAGVNGYIYEIMKKYADEVRTDALENVISRIGNKGPKCMVSAHQDEIGMIVTAINEDGTLGIFQNGGVDPRILPAMEVMVQAESGPLYGVIGSKPPHLLTPEEKDIAVKMEDLYVDIGYGRQESEKLVKIGDVVVLHTRPQKLLNGKFAQKTMDDRASVASLVIAAQMLKNMRFDGTAYLVASSQEEVGCKGAQTAAYSIDPDWAIAIDVTHGEGPGTGKFEAFPLDKMTIAVGPYLHPALVEIAEDVARKYHIPFTNEACSSSTGTDADNIQTVRGGIPTILLSIPLKYMHTTVETLKLGVVEDVGRLVALLIAEVSARWEEIKWF